MEKPYCHNRKSPENGREYMLNNGTLKYCKECADVDRCWDGGKDAVKSLLKEEIKKAIDGACEQVARDIRENKHKH